MICHLLDWSIVGCKWVYYHKCKVDGTLDRYKTRFVTKGFTQLKRIDYNETFSPMVKIISLWILFALATIHDYHVHQLDVQIAFLHGHLNEEIWNNPLVTCLYQMKIKFVSFWKLFMDWNRIQDFGMQDLIFNLGYQKCALDTNVYIGKMNNKTFVVLGLYEHCKIEWNEKIAMIDKKGHFILSCNSNNLKTLY